MRLGSRTGTAALKSRWMKALALALVLHLLLGFAGLILIQRHQMATRAFESIPLEPLSHGQTSGKSKALRPDPDSPLANPEPSAKIGTAPDSKANLNRRAISDLAAAIRNRTSAHLRLPPGFDPASRREVLLHLSISASGALISISIERSSGDEALDEAAQVAVLASAPYGDLTRQIEGFSGAEFRLPVRVQRRR